MIKGITKKLKKKKKSEIAPYCHENVTIQNKF